MSEFYARYIPPSTSQAQQSILKRPNASKPTRSTKKRKTEDTREASDLLSKYSVTGAAKETDHVKKSKKHADNGVTSSEWTPSKRQKQRSDRGDEVKLNKEQIEEDSVPIDEQDGLVKHTRVLSRFSKAKNKAAQNRENADEVSTNNVHPDRVKLHDLAPLPQPEAPTVEVAKPSYSTAPAWLDTPLRVGENAQESFDNLRLHETVRNNLKSQEKTLALPVQAAVLPLLLDQPVERRPDLCIAAATGSGKTFAYALPIIDSLQGWQTLKLQAVVIVPTRALVKQVLQTLKSCSAGLDLRIGTAEGSRSIAEERQQLIEETWIYNPAEYKRQQEAPPDWSTFSLDDLLVDAERHDLFENIGHVKEYKSKVNILVCTPGRLVEHLQSTKGFHLDHVQWFVADEADRLLNESYHEWLDVVLPALKSQTATDKVDRLLRQMKMDVPQRRVTKILLSATMTNDISQLLALELTNPRMVIIEDATNMPADVAIPQTSSEGGYQLPAKLYESAIAFKDSENKPLYLIELLTKHIFSGQTIGPDAAKGNNGTTRSESGTSSGEPSDSSESSDESEESDVTSSSGSDSSSEEDETTSISSSSDSSKSSSSVASASNSPPVLKTVPSGALKTHPRTKKTKRPHPRVLIFTKSTESAHRLSRLLCILDPSLVPLINTFTRSPTTPGDSKDKATVKSFLKTRNKILASFTNGQTRILISTDLAARGLDIPHLEHVVNYDVPASALTYVHRVGRTARAGEEGQAWTLVEHKQGKWFWETIGGRAGKVKDGQYMIKRGDKVVKKVNLTIDKERWESKYEDALRQLGEDVRGQ